MNNREKRELITDLLIDVNAIKADLPKFEGNPEPALVERLVKVINLLTPHADLFDDSFKIKIKEYISCHEEARKGLEKVFTLVKPTDILISDTLENMLKELNS